MSWTLSVAVQQPFITDFNSHTHEFLRPSYHLIDTFEIDFQSRTTEFFATIIFDIRDVYLWNCIPDSNRLLKSKINKYKPHELKNIPWRISYFCKISPKNESK